MGKLNNEISTVKELVIMTRSEKAGRDMAKSLMTMVHLMYQLNTAQRFFLGFMDEFRRELHSFNPDGWKIEFSFAIKNKNKKQDKGVHF